MKCGRKPGYKTSEESKRKISEGNKGKAGRPIGYKVSPETIEKQRQSIKAFWDNIHKHVELYNGKET